MKAKFILTIAATIIAITSEACDVCGCSLGGNYFGLLPLFNKSFVGLRWSQAKFYAYMDHQSAYLQDEYSHDTYRRLELWGGFYVSPTIQVFAFVPYNYNSMNGTEQIVSDQGLGDIQLVATAMLLNHLNANSGWSHTWMAGGGLKLPTGRFGLEDNGKIVNPNFQMGTGSVDFLVNSIYTVRHRQVGATIETGYKINTRNANGYLFGNQFHTSSVLFARKPIGSVTIVPNAGLRFEQADMHHDKDIIQVNSGGETLLASIGLNVYLNGLSAGLDFEHPVAQYYNSDEIADIKARNRWNATLTYSF